MKRPAIEVSMEITLPHDLIEAINEATGGTDRSRFVRDAIREKLARNSIASPELVKVPPLIGAGRLTTRKEV